MAPQNIDQEGWNLTSISRGELQPVTVIRLRYLTCILREKVLDIALGGRAEQSSEDLWYVSWAIDFMDQEV